MYDSGISSIQNAGATTYRLSRHPLQALNMSLNTIKSRSWSFVPCIPPFMGALVFILLAGFSSF
jgi:hypothetical protein